MADAWARRGSPRSPGAATGTCATSSTPATRCPGSPTSARSRLPGPDQALGGREAHSVLGYLTDGSVWSDWFLPGLHHGLGFFWPLLGALGPRRPPALPRPRVRARSCESPALVGLAAALAWLIAPTSASGPDGMPRGFESGLRYLAPALILGLALLPVTPPLRDRLQSWVGRASMLKAPHTSGAGHGTAMGMPARTLVAAAVVVLLVGDRGRLPGPAPLPGEPLRGPHIHHPGPERRLQVGQLDLRRPDSDHQHPPVPAVRHRPLQPRPVRRPTRPPTAASSPRRPAGPGAASSTRATTTT